MAAPDHRQAHLRDELEADFEETNELEAPEEQPERPPRFCGLTSGLAVFVLGCLSLEAFMYLISTPEVPLWCTLPFFFIPFALLALSTWFWHAKITTFGRIVQPFMLGATFVTACVCIAQMMLIGFWIVLVLGFDDDDAAEGGRDVAFNASQWQNATQAPAPPPEEALSAWMVAASFLFLALIALPLPECFATYVAVVQSNRGQGHSKNFVINSLYIGLGYATGESLFAVIGEALRQESRIARYLVPEVPWYELMWWVFYYLALSAPLQMLVGYGAGLLIAEAREKDRPLDWKKVNGFAWAARAVYYLFYVGAIFAEYWPPWVFIVGAVVEAILVIVWIKKVERSMPAAYLAKVGYLHVFGYGVLPQVEEITGCEEMAATGPSLSGPTPGSQPPPRRPEDP